MSAQTVMTGWFVHPERHGGRWSTWHIATPLWVLALTLGLAAPLHARERSGGSPVEPLAASLQQEPCFATARTDIADFMRGGRELELKCGDRSIGTLWQLPAHTIAPESPRAMIERAQALPELATIRAVLACSIEHTHSERQTALAPCRLRSGGWPAILAVGRSAGTVRVGFGPPAALPALLHWSTAAEVDPADKRVPNRLLEDLFGGKVPLASAADFRRMTDLARDARVANSEGRDSDAERMLREVLDQQRQLLSEFDTATAHTMLELALSVANQGRSIEAATLLRQAEPTLDRSPSTLERARLDVYRGLVAASSGAFRDAMQFAAAAAAALRSDDDPSRSVDLLTPTEADSRHAGPARPPPGELILALNLQAAMALREGEIEVADVAASESLRWVEALPDSPPAWRPEILLTLGRVSSAKGRISAAETYLRTALAFQRKNSGDGQRSLAILAALGEAYEREGMHTSALNAFGEMSAVLDQWSAIEPPRLPHEWLIPLARATLARHDRLESAEERRILIEQAFDLLRRASPERLALTADRIAQEQERADPGYAGLREAVRVAGRERDLAQLSLAIESARPDRSRSRVAESELEQELRDAQSRLDSARQALDRHHGASKNLLQPSNASAGSVRAQLLPDEALVQYLIGESGSFAAIVRPEGIDWVALPAVRRATLDSDVAELRQALWVEGGPARPFDIDLAARLSEQLLRPLMPSLRGVGRLQLVTGGALAALPFAVLPDPAGPTEAGRSPSWLIERYVISHTPSIAIFHSQRTRARGTDPRIRPALALGVSQWGPTPNLRDGEPEALPGSGLDRLNARCRDGQSPEPALLAALPSLPGVEDEVAALSRTLAGRGARLAQRLNAEATEGSLRSEVLSGYGMLYFATHAVLPGTSRCINEPALALSLPRGNRSRDDDGLLEASEVASLQLNADLVVLSACNTASRSNSLSGESLTGLAHAFFSAGARKVLATHWPVESRRTAELMASVFRAQRAPDYDDIADALRDAQIAMLRTPETSHPWFWAAFTVLGTGPRQERR